LQSCELSNHFAMTIEVVYCMWICSYLLNAPKCELSEAADNLHQGFMGGTPDQNVGG